MYYRKFKISKTILKKLSMEETQVLKLLSEVVRDAGELYELQVSEGFYPEGVTKAELEKAASGSQNIFSPFTMVAKSEKGFEATPFHKKYADILAPIAKKIVKAAKITRNQSFRKYLKARAKSLLDGSYKQADIAWLAVRGANIDFNIGPFERYLDKLAFVKRSYQAHVGIIDRDFTKQAEGIKETLYSSAKVSFDKHHSIEIPRRGVCVMIERTPATSGYVADALFSGEHFPCDLDVMQKYGSKIIIYGSQLKLKFEKLHYPIFKAIFEKRFALNYPKELLLRATGLYILLYELSRQLHKFPDARSRLKELYGPIDEANGYASGIGHSKHLVVKGLVTHEELEAVIIIHIVWMFADWLSFEKKSGYESYVLGNAIGLNTYLNEGALREQNGISWPNFSRIFFQIEILSNKLVELLQNGSYKQAESLIGQFSDVGCFEKLGKNIKGISFDF